MLKKKSGGARARVARRGARGRGRAGPPPPCVEPGRGSHGHRGPPDARGHRRLRSLRTTYLGTMRIGDAGAARQDDVAADSAATE